MADIKVNREQSQERGGGRSQQVERRGEMFPGLFSSPRDWFSMNPLQMMRRMSEEMDRVFGGWGGQQSSGFWAPPVEIRQQGNNLMICADLPGLNKDDVKIEVTEAGLAISGERKHEQKEEREGFYRSERSYGRFYRLIPLPEEAQIDQAKAQFNNGVLEVVVPVPQSQQKRREIPIEAGGGEKTRTSGGGA